MHPHRQAVLHSPQPAALRPRMVLDSPHPFRVVLHSLLLTHSFMWRHTGRDKAYVTLWSRAGDNSVNGRACRFWSPVSGWSQYHGGWAVVAGQLMITFRCNGTLPFVVHFFNRDEPNDQTQMTWHTWTDVDKIRHIVPHKLSATDLLIGPGAYI